MIYERDTFFLHIHFFAAAFGANPNGLQGLEFGYWTTMVQQSAGGVLSITPFRLPIIVCVVSIRIILYDGRIGPMDDCA